MRVMSGPAVLPALTPRCLAGDLARWLPTGNVEFLGRLDDQVHIIMPVC